MVCLSVHMLCRDNNEMGSEWFVSDFEAHHHSLSDPEWWMLLCPFSLFIMLGHVENVDKVAQWIWIKLENLFLLCINIINTYYSHQAECYIKDLLNRNNSPHDGYFIYKVIVEFMLKWEFQWKQIKVRASLEALENFWANPLTMICHHWWAHHIQLSVLNTLELFLISTTIQICSTKI